MFSVCAVKTKFRRWEEVAFRNLLVAIKHNFHVAEDSSPDCFSTLQLGAQGRHFAWQSISVLSFRGPAAQDLRRELIKSALELHMRSADHTYSFVSVFDIQSLHLGATAVFRVGDLTERPTPGHNIGHVSRL